MPEVQVCGSTKWGQEFQSHRAATSEAERGSADHLPSRDEGLNIMARRRRTYNKPKIETKPLGAEAPAEEAEEKESTTEAKALVAEPEVELEIVVDPDPEPEPKPVKRAPAKKLPAPRCSHCGEDRCFKGRRGDKLICSNCRQLVLIV